MLKREGTWLIHVNVRQEHCKATTLQLKINFKKFFKIKKNKNKLKKRMKKKQNAISKD